MRAVRYGSLQTFPNSFLLADRAPCLSLELQNIVAFGPGFLSKRNTHLLNNCRVKSTCIADPPGKAEAVVGDPTHTPADHLSYSNLEYLVEYYRPTDGFRSM